MARWTPPLRYTISNNGVGCRSVTEITNICLYSIEITQDSDVPADVSALTKIRGNLIIQGNISTFPDFSALKVVEGNSQYRSPLEPHIDHD